MIELKRVGKLTQAAEELPFRPKRVYWIDTQGEARGNHAHKMTRQVFTCIKGSYILVVNDGVSVNKYFLSADKPQGIYITDEWHTMESCSPDCIIMVMASELCDEKDYIRDFEKWKEWINACNTTTI